MVIPPSLRCVFLTISFWLVLSAQLQIAGSSSSIAARRLLQGDGAGDTPACPPAQCAAPPCSIRPCLAGWTAENDFCTCTCNCTPPPDFAGLPPDTANRSSSSSSGGGTAGMAPNAALNAQEAQAMQRQEPGQQLPAGNWTCGRLYQPCTCSARCCAGLVCGFAPRGPLTAEQQAVADAARSDGTGAGANATGDTDAAAMGAAGLLPGNRTTGVGKATGSRGLNGSHSVALNGSVLVVNNSRLAGTAVGDPSCRPAELVDVRSGMINYGC